MAATPSFLYTPDLGTPGSTLALSREEAHYVSRVCRARAGDLADATDGRGAIARLRLTSVGRDAGALVLSVERVERKARGWIWCGAPERGRADWLVEKLAELGVERFQPLDCAGTRWAEGAVRVERWKRIAVAALRQSRRAHLLEVRPPAALEDVLGTLERPAACWIGDPAGQAPAPRAHTTVPEVGAIGPSGGFRVAERERLDAAGFVPIRLADGRLRTETAALSLAAWWSVGGRDDRIGAETTG